MCKHVSAVLYGVGARLDEKPQLLFVLRGVDETELIAGGGQDLSLSKAAPSAAKVLNDTDVAALFGLEMAETAASDSSSAPKRPKVSKTASSDASTAPKQRKGSEPLKRRKPPAKTTKPAATKPPGTLQHNPPRGSRSRPEPKWVSLVLTRKRRANRRAHRAA
jgi:uncharacterized Zn finger protein